MSKLLAVVTVCAMGTLAAACAAPTEGQDEGVSTSAPAASESGLTSEQTQSLAKVKVATSKYQDVKVALADGYIADSACYAIPGGAMGIHYFNVNLMFAPPDPLKPSILLYEPTSDGPKLVGVEYFQAVFVNGQPYFAPAEVPPPPPPQSNPAPSLFGQTFDGPMPGHNPQMPWHYDLHAWIWKSNPNGMFSAWNSKVSCGK